MYHLSILAVRRPVAVTVIILALVLFGGISLQRIGVDLLPDVDFQVAVIAVPYPNASAEMIEHEVTIPIENSLAGVTGIRRMDSFSLENISATIIQLDWTANMLDALDAIRSNLAQVALQLPSGAHQPLVARIDPNEFPLMVIGATSDSLSELELSAKLRKLRPQIEQLPGVGEVGLLGASELEVEVLFQPESLEELDLTPALLHQLIMYQNMLVPGGAISDAKKRYHIRTGHRIESLEELGELVIGTQPTSGLLGLGGLVPAFIQLSDVAEINQIIRQRAGFTRLNKTDTVLIRVSPQSGANSVRVAQDVHRMLAILDDTHQDIQFEAIVDQSRFITAAIRDLAYNAAIGAMLALTILFLFLRNWQSLLVVGTAIPISIIASFIMVYFSNLTLNLMTLGGLALGGGMLVDSSIVVLENIHRHRMEGQDTYAAAESGSQEIASAIVASTATTLAVFLPVIFMQTIAGELFKELGLTVSFSLFASLIVALTVVPMLTSRMRTMQRFGDPTAYGPLFTKVQALYGRWLTAAITRRGIVLSLVAVAIVLAILIVPTLGDEFFPTMDEGFVGLQLILPAGVPLETTRGHLADLEEALLQVPEVQALAIQVGDQGDTDIISQIYGGNTHTADLQIVLVPARQRSRSTSEVAQELRKLAVENGALRAVIEGTSLLGAAAGFVAPSLLLEIRGEDRQELSRISEEIMAQLREIPGFFSIQDSAMQTVSDLFLQVDPARSLSGGLTAGQVGLAVHQTMSGIKATDVYIDGQSLPVLLRPAASLSSIEDLMGTPLMSPVPLSGMDSQSVVLGRVAQAHIQPAPPHIQRTNRRGVINITAQLDTLDLSTATREGRRIVDGLELPPGYSVSVGGLNELIDESTSDLLLALTLAVLLVYVVLAVQFESFLHPLCIMCAVPLAMIGAVVAIWLTGNNIGVASLIGMIVLAGIVVNNAIVFVDYINLQRRQGCDVQQAILNAGRLRLRPILMTATTTILGLIPLALGFGEGSELQVPLAITVIGGLVTSTLLTLFVIPVAYSYLSQGLANHAPRSQGAGRGQMGV